jgi:hypothetical protein
MFSENLKKYIPYESWGVSGALFGEAAAEGADDRSPPPKKRPVGAMTFNDKFLCSEST